MPVYVDHNASTPLHPLVLDAFCEAARDVHGNASSVHGYGQRAKQRLEGARRSVAKLIGASSSREVVFTGGGTESDNLAIFGAVLAAKRSRKHVITSEIEHPAVLAVCDQLAHEGVAVTFLPPSASGLIDPADVRAAMRDETVLVSVMHANNETGAIQHLREIAEIAHMEGALFHADGVQAAGRIAVDVRELGVDLYSLSAHKMNGPKGAGALYVKEKTPLRALQFGGPHERERRAGTENIPALVGFGVAADLLHGRPAESSLRDLFENELRRAFPAATVHCAETSRLPNTSSVRFPGCSGEALVIALDLAGFAVSSGSACASGSIEPSHVLLAMGLTEAEARSSLRFSFGLGNTEDDVRALVRALDHAVPNAPATVRAKARAASAPARVFEHA